MIGYGRLVGLLGVVSAVGEHALKPGCQDVFHRLSQMPNSDGRARQVTLWTVNSGSSDRRAPFPSAGSAPPGTLRARHPSPVSPPAWPASNPTS